VLNFSLSPPDPRGKSSCIHCTEGWLDPTASPHTSKIRIPLYCHKSNTNSSVVQTLGSSLFQMSYPGHWAKPCNYRGIVRINVILQRVRVTTVTVQKQQVLQISVCVCDLHDPASKAHAPDCRVTCLVLPYFSTSHKPYDFREKVIENKMCFDFVYSFCLKHFSS
jgi:hypothetical protein